MNGSLTATTSTLGLVIAARHTRRPILPNPLIPNLQGIVFVVKDSHQKSKRKRKRIKGERSGFYFVHSSV